MCSLPTQFELFADSYCADLDKINERIKKLNRNKQQELSPQPPSIPCPPSLPNQARLKSPRYNQFSKPRIFFSADENNTISLTSRINATAKIVKPKRTAPTSPRQIQW